MCLKSGDHNPELESSAVNYVNNNGAFYAAGGTKRSSDDIRRYALQNNHHQYSQVPMSYKIKYVAVIGGVEVEIDDDLVLDIVHGLIEAAATVFIVHSFLYWTLCLRMAKKNKREWSLWS